MNREYVLSLVYRSTQTNYRPSFVLTIVCGEVEFEVPSDAGAFRLLQSEFFRGVDRTEWNEAAASSDTLVRVDSITVNDYVLNHLRKFRVPCTV